MHCRKKGVGNVGRKGGAKEDENDLQDEGAERGCQEQGERDGLCVCVCVYKSFWLVDVELRLSLESCI